MSQPSWRCRWLISVAVWESAQAVSASRTFTLTVKAVKAGTDEVAGQASAATRDPDPGKNFASTTITIRRH